MSQKKPIQIYARLKPTTGEPFPFDVESVDSDGTNDDILVFNMKGNVATDEGYYVHKQQENHRFRYSKVFERSTTQEEIFDAICRPVLDSALEGYNGTIFAYGQTGSGKTFTMTGSRYEFSERGIIPRALQYIFQRFRELDSTGTQCQALYISYLEIYNECGYDLLHPDFLVGKIDELKKVVLMEDGNQQIHLRNLSVNPVNSEDDAMQLFYTGEHHRTIAETPMNDWSTRSHCIFTIHFNIRETVGSLVRRSKVHLVDLAGSERIANSNISGQLFNEARHINLALHYLEQVIVALGEPNRHHIPYRNSMMTSILRDSLGGNCMTSMIATLSLDYKNIPETLSTCRFSQRVALVTNDATLNEELDPELLIQQLKSEIKRLKATIASSSIQPVSEESEPLTEPEFNDCCRAVQQFLMDPDEEAVLAIAPDMRLIQKCFQCLKCACTETQMKANKALQQVYKSSKMGEDITSDQLTKTLACRENEIRVLTRMLKEANEKNRQHEQVIASGCTNIGNKLIASKASSRENDVTLAQLDAVTQKLAKPPYSPPITSRPLIDKETLLIEGFSSKKKQAFEEFLKSYSEKEQLDDVREELFKRRRTVDKLKEDMNKDHGSLNKLKRSMMSAITDEEVELTNTLIKDALNKQERALMEKEKELVEATKEMEQCENNLKLHYGRMVESFENWHNNNNNGHQSSEDNLASSETTSPFNNLAYGVVKRSSLENPRMIEFKSSIPELPKVKKYALHSTSSSPKRIWSSESEKMPTLNFAPTSDIIIEKTDFKLTRSKREQSEQSIESLLGCKIKSSHLEEPSSFPPSPPPTANPVINKKKNKSKSKPPPVQSTDHPALLSARQLPSVLTISNNPTPVESNLEIISLKSPKPKTKDRTKGAVAKDCPMTGDPSTDREILNFIRKRQAVFRKINEDKLAGRSFPDMASVEQDKANRVQSNAKSEPI